MITAFVEANKSDDAGADSGDEQFASVTAFEI